MPEIQLIGLAVKLKARKIDISLKKRKWSGERNPYFLQRSKGNEIEGRPIGRGDVENIIRM